MTPKEFRKLALALEGVVELSHMGHPDFRADGKIFATLGAPDEDWGMVKLTPEQQQSFLRTDARTFRPCSGAWGRSGSTNVHLASAKPSSVKAALDIARENVAAAAAPKRKPKPSHSDKPQPTTQRYKQSTLAAVRKRLVKIVDSLPEATSAPAGDGHLSLEVRGKRFGYFLVNHHGDGRLALNCKAEAGVTRRLVAQDPERFHVPKYVGRHGWVGLWLDLPEVDWEDVASLVKDAYRLTAPPTLARDVS